MLILLSYLPLVSELMKSKSTILALITLLISTSSIFAKNNACDLWQDLPNERYNEVIKYQDDLFKKLSNTRVFYKISDQLLTKVSSESYKAENKNELLTKWAAYSQLTESKQSDIITEWRKQFFHGIIIPSYLQLTPTQQAVIDQAFTDLHQFTFTDQIKKSYSEIFSLAQKLSYKLIDSQRLNKETAMILKGNIARLKLNWIERIKGSPLAKDPSTYFQTDISYNPEHNVITIGQRAARHIDGDTILSIMIQQMALSISPCRWSILYRNKPNPYEKVLTCLRGVNSIHAKERDDSKIDFLMKEKKITSQQKIELDKYPRCNTPFYPPIGIQFEQINTAFSDWFSAEAISTFKKLSANFREDLCSIKATTTLEEDPPNYERLVRVYLANKKIRKLTNMKVGKNIVQCKL